jgi:dihydropteroate synthase
MAIVNATPDSFYEGARSVGRTAGLERIAEAVEQGADIVDIGGVKAGVGPDVSVGEELDRVLPLVSEARSRWPDLVISVDTWRAAVAAEVCAAGADVINDAWGGADPDLVTVAADRGAGLVCAHTGGQRPRTNPHRVWWDDVVTDALATLTAAAEAAVAAGVLADGIVIDPAHDFGKNSRHSLALTRSIDRLAGTGWPVLVALSRKDFIGEALAAPPADRLDGTLAATAVSAWLGARVFRAHDVKATRRVLDVVAAIRGEADLASPRRGLV